MTIAISFFLAVPHYGRQLWPQVLEYWDKNNLSYTTVFLGIGLNIHNSLHFIHHSVYYIFYHFEFPFIERYKCNDIPWPWNEDKERWRRLLRKSILVVLFNSNVIPMILYMVLSHFKLLKQHAHTLDEIPDTKTLVASICFFMVCEDFAFFMSHRLLHW